MGLFSTIFARGEQKRSDDLDAQLAAMNAERLQSGYYTPDQYATATANLDAGRLDVNAEVKASFVEGAKQGAGNVRNTIGSTISGTLKTIGSLLPWQVWVILAGVAVFYLWPVIGPALGARLKRS